VILAFPALALRNASAGSAVAWGPGHLGTAYGAPVDVARVRALENCRRKGVPNPRLLGSTDVFGYGAIVIALTSGHGSLIGIALGKRSATEAGTLAIAQCVKAGRIHARVRWGFRG
jgi:hypothetical protein